MAGPRPAQHPTAAALKPSRRAEWDTFIDSLRPGPEQEDRLKQFRFHTPTTRPAATQPADEPVLGAMILLGERK